jgi:hypothetical protein
VKASRLSWGVFSGTSMVKQMQPRIVRISADSLAIYPRVSAFIRGEFFNQPARGIDPEMDAECTRGPR